ncbi:mucin-12 [Aplysia californica]|uniref:Mucin-12 n=1 Tax=Aplysia californica TaxID=6500 RepID=A0ABM0KB64_APLCA|nr:mucin-12 [Aplysia californica]
MAEIRIPRDRIPHDILLRLQAIGQSVMFPVTGSPPPTQPASQSAVTSSATNYSVSTAPLFTNTSAAAAVWASSTPTATAAATTAVPGVAQCSSSSSPSSSSSSSSSFPSLHSSSLQFNPVSIPVATTACPAQIHIDTRVSLSPDNMSSTSLSPSLQSPRLSVMPSSMSSSPSLSHTPPPPPQPSSSLPFNSLASSPKIYPTAESTPLSHQTQSSASITHHQKSNSGKKSPTRHMTSETRHMTSKPRQLTSEPRAMTSEADLRQQTIDETDGADPGSIVHVLSEHPNSKRHKPEVDDSDIVRVFPLADEHDSEEVDSSQRYPVDDDSGIVRIFPESYSDVKRQQGSSPFRENDTGGCTAEESNMVNVFSPSKRADSQSGVPSCTNARAGSKTDICASEMPAASTVRYLPPPQHSFTSPAAFNNSRSHHAPSHLSRPNSSGLHFPSNHASRTSPTPPSLSHSPSANQTPSRHSRASPQTTQKLLDAQDFSSGNNRHGQQTVPKDIITPAAGRKLGHFRHSSALSVCAAARRSPEIPTPPQTPDDAEDDEVFSYDVVSVADDGFSSRRLGVDAFRLSQESTPQKESHAPLRHNSDSRSYESRHAHGFRTSPFSPAQKMSELNVGDRQHTRKRLSFEEEDLATPLSSSQTIQYHSDSALANHSSQYFHACNTFAPQIFASQGQLLRLPNMPINSLANQRNCPQSPSPCMSQAPPSSVQNAPLASTSVLQSHTPTKCEPLAPPPSPFRPTSVNPSSIPEVKDIIERLSSPGQMLPRSRLHSDGDREAESQMHTFGGSPVYGRGSPVLAPPRARGQTFSHGKRRRLDHCDEHDGPSPTFGSAHSQSIPRPESTEAKRETCACATIERNFLQMAEGAYKNIRRMDSTVADFDRFRQELAQTNTILRESFAIIENFKSICEHKGVSSMSSDNVHQFG